MSKPKLYLDIDGTLLHADHSRWGFGVAPGAIEFLEWAVERFEIRWLSTRCRNGNAEEARRAFRLAGAGSPSVLRRIHAAKWGRYKTDAIDLLTSDWWWVDNAPDEHDLALLREHGLHDHLILVEDGHAGALERVRERLEGILRSESF